MPKFWLFFAVTWSPQLRKNKWCKTLALGVVSNCRPHHVNYSVAIQFFYLIEFSIKDDLLCIVIGPIGKRKFIYNLSNLSDSDVH